MLLVEVTRILCNSTTLIVAKLGLLEAVEVCWWHTAAMLSRVRPLLDDLALMQSHIGLNLGLMLQITEIVALWRCLVLFVVRVSEISHHWFLEESI